MIARIIGAVFAAELFCGSGWADGVDAAEVGAVVAAERLIEKGNPQQALELLRRAMQAAQAEGMDATIIRFMIAQALLKMGRVEEAAALLERLAAGRLPLNHVQRNRIQLDYAAALFALRRDFEAGEIFREIWRKNGLPPAVRRNVERYLERIRARQKLRIDFDLGFWWDNNVNNAPERETVEVPQLGGLRFTASARPVRAWVAHTGLSLRWRHSVSESGATHWETHASAARNTAINASALNRTWLRVSAGPRVQYSAKISGQQRPGAFRGDIGIERRWRGGDSYALSAWGGMGFEQSIARTWRAGLYHRHWRTRYEEETERNDPHGRSIAPYVMKRIGPGYLTVRRVHSREAPGRPSLRWTSREAQVVYATDSGRDWILSLQTAWAGTDFDDAHPLFLQRRKDRTHRVSLTISHRALAHHGYLPQLRLGWSKTSSNIPLYERKSRSFQVSWRRLF